MEVRIAATERLWEELRLALNEEEESAAVLLAGRAEEPGRITLCLNRAIWIPREAYALRRADEMKIRSEGWMPALAAAAAGNWQPIFFHTHPGADPRPSHHDHQVARGLAPVFGARTGKPYASLILGGSAASPRFTGTLGADPVHRLRVVGDRIRLFASADRSPGGDAGSAASFDRQIRAFGRDGQGLLKRLRVGVVGAGGTGSAVFEQLVRLGVSEIVLIDDDEVSATNLTRIHGSTMADVGKPKVDVLAASARDIGLGTVVETRCAKVTERGAFEVLRGCDVVFGCTDDNVGRAVLSRLAYHYCTAVIDLGVVISAAEDEVRSLDARVSVMTPGTPCLFCRGRIDPYRLREEQLPEDEREGLAEEGYARGLADPDPAVITYTTMTAAFAVDEMLQRLFGYGEETPSSEILIRPPRREVRRLAGAPVGAHFCVDPDVLGRADREPPLGIGWS
jgi:molybdopterin/thiamine biosynthesis adenylyltransferase/proteasome lid subunit RPN8/RPN11